MEKNSLSNTSCNSNYLNYFSSSAQLINYEKATPKIILASDQISLHLQQQNSEQFFTRGLKNTSILSATQHFCYKEFKVLPHPFLKSSLFLCNIPGFRKYKLVFSTEMSNLPALLKRKQANKSTISSTSMSTNKLFKFSKETKFH